MHPKVNEKGTGYSIFAHSRPEASGLRGFCLVIFKNIFYGLSTKETAQILHPVPYANLVMNYVDQERRKKCHQ